MRLSDCQTGQKPQTTTHGNEYLKGGRLPLTIQCCGLSFIDMKYFFILGGMGYGKSVRYLTGQVKFYTHQSLGDIIEQRRGCIQIAHHSKIAYFLHLFYSNKEFKIGKTNFKNIKESCLIKNRIMSARKQDTKVKAKINQKTNQEIWIKTNKLGKKPKLLRSNFFTMSVST